MGAIDETLQANEQYAKNFSLGGLPTPPARKLAVVACMDARLTVEQCLGLKTGDAHIIRNAGGSVTEDAIRSLVISQHLLGTREIMIINHTGCGMLTFRDDELLARLERETGAAAVSPAHFYTFSDLSENVRRQVRRVRSHPWILKESSVRGFIYDVKNGQLTEVKA
jgi:carbonic anhydrase